MEDESGVGIGHENPSGPLSCPIERNQSIHVLRGECREHECWSGVNQFDDFFFQVELAEALLLLAAEVGAFHQKDVDVPRCDLLDQSPDHARFPAVRSQVAGIEQRFPSGFQEEGEAPEGAVIDRIRRDGELADPESHTGLGGAMAIPIQLRSIRKNPACEHHLAGPGGGVDRDFRSGMVQEPGVIEVGVRKQDRVRGGCIVREQPRDWSDGPVGDQFLTGRTEGLEGIEGFSIGIDQGKAEVL